MGSPPCAYSCLWALLRPKQLPSCVQYISVVKVARAESDCLLAGMDVSGDPVSGSHKFMAIVIGTDESIRSLTVNLGSKPIHMKNLHRRDRDDVINRVKFDRRTIAGYCIHLEKNRTFSKVYDRFKRKGRLDRTNRKKLSRTYNALLWMGIRSPLEEFLLQHGHITQDLIFQCDVDCRDFAKDRGWDYENRGPAYVLADILAWCNSHGQELDGSVYLDLADLLEQQTLKRFK